MQVEDGKQNFGISFLVIGLDFLISQCLLKINLSKRGKKQ